MPEPLYRVTTWDAERQEFTPQDDVPPEARGTGELRRRLWQLRGMGYETTKAAGFAVSVVRLEPHGGTMTDEELEQATDPRNCGCTKRGYEFAVGFVVIVFGAIVIATVLGLATMQCGGG